MKSFNEAAQGIGGAPAPRPPSGALGCEANGCPLAGTVSEGTRGQGPWLCAEHFFRGDVSEDQVTLRIRNAIAAGAQFQLPRDRRPYPGDSPAVRDMKSRVMRGGTRRYPDIVPPAPSVDRIPGEDDE